MNPKFIWTIMLGGLLAAVSWTAQDTGGGDESRYEYDRYEIVSQQNIFSRSRRPARSQDDDRPMPQKSVVMSLYVLKGVAVNGTQRIAFIEDEVSGEVLQVSTGNTLSNGRISDIQDNCVVFDQNGQSRQVTIGGIFVKTESMVDVSPDDEQPAPVPEETSEDTVSEESDILKKLMERRQSELGT